MVQKILIILKNFSSEDCTELNFLKEGNGGISLSTLGEEVRELKDLCF